MSFNTHSFTKNKRDKTPSKISANISGRVSMSKPTHYLLGAALSVGLMASALSPSEAAMVKLGNVDVQIDTTVSVGATFLMSDREKQYLPLANGGPADISAYGSASAATKALVDEKKAGDHGALDDDGDFVNDSDEEVFNMRLGAAARGGGCNKGYGQYCQEIVARPNFDGSINTDDGRLNFDSGDLVSAPLKFTSEIEAGSGAWNAFARVTAFYDAILMDDGSFEREGGGLSDKGETLAGRDLRLLDAYLDYDGEVGNMPFLIRAGRQVINWGEATFIPGGNSAFSPIDVAAIRRPGAEIKEALLPVEALYGSIALTQDITLEAYVGGWDEFQLESGGTLFGGSDVFTPGSKGGNPHNVYYIGGGGFSGDKFACDGDTAFGTLGNPDGTLGNADDISYYLSSAQIIAAVKGIEGAVKCDGNPNLNPNRRWTVGQAEVERAKAGDTAIIRGLANDDGSESIGLAVRWYAENLNSTEFALYYQKIDSRLPYISFKTGKAGVRAGSISSQTSTVGRGAGITGCVGTLTNATILQAGTPGAKAYNPAYAAIELDDGKNILSNPAIQAVANTVAGSLGAFLNVVSKGAISTYTRSAPVGDNVAYFQETLCLLALGQRNGDATLGSGFDGVGQLHTGATNLAIAPNIGLFAEYPEVEVMGFSFNTTAFGWGVQGDFTFRPEMPLQFDTDSLTIASLFNNCAFTTVGVLEGIYQSGATYGNEASDSASLQDIGCTGADRYLQGYTTDHDAYTWDIGTTATFTRSNPVVSFLGADLGILLTEFQGVIAEDIEEMRGNTGGLINPDTGMYDDGRGITPLSNVCQGGSDLPLNGILSIDDRTVGDASTDADNNPKGYCRPTDSSWGAVLFAQLQYNNVFGTPFALRPTFVYSEGMEGYSPSPLGFWREGVGSTSIRLDASYLDALQFGVAYTDYQGDIDRTRNLDRNTLSLNVSYAF